MTEDDRALGTKAVQAMVGDVSVMTLWRWIRERGFPRPFKVGGNLNRWWQSEVRAWLERQAAQIRDEEGRQP